MVLVTFPLPCTNTNSRLKATYYLSKWLKEKARMIPHTPTLIFLKSMMKEELSQIFQQQAISRAIREIDAKLRSHPKLLTGLVNVTNALWIIINRDSIQ